EQDLSSSGWPPAVEIAAKFHGSNRRIELSDRHLRGHIHLKGGTIGRQGGIRKVVKKENRQFLRTAGGQVEVTIIVIAAVYPKPADEAFPIRPGVDIKLEIKTFAWRTGNVVSGNIHIGVDQSKLIGGTD